MNRNSHRYKLDYILFFTVIALLLVGLMMVYSASYIWADYKYGDAFFYVKRQVFFGVVGFICMVVISYIPYTALKKYATPILIICAVLLIGVLIPGIGIIRGGARSWIGIGLFSIQPSEFMKLGLIIFLAKLLSKKKDILPSFLRGFLPVILLISLVFGLIMLQPDLGTGVVLVLTSLVLVFIAGAKLKHFFGLGLVGLLGFVFLIISAPYRIKRITAFLDPWKNPLGEGFQIIQSLYAVGPGRLMGVGLGNSIQKYFYLPEPQTDFIFSILAEEFGFIGGVLLICLFFCLFLRGIKIALHIHDTFAEFLAIGIIVMLILQMMINISVVIGLIPVTGITLPFLSYGGSSLTLSLCAVGILLNISRYAKF